MFCAHSWRHILREQQLRYLRCLERVNNTINMLILLRFTVNSGMRKAAIQNNKNFTSDLYGFHLSVQNKTPSQINLQLLLWTIYSI